MPKAPVAAIAISIPGTGLTNCPTVAASINVKTNSKGHLYVVYGDSSLGDKDIFLLVSKDKGETWLPKVRVNNDPTNNGRDQYMPNITIDPTDDQVYIVYYDRQYSSSNIFLDVTVASTSDGKKAFTEWN